MESAPDPRFAVCELRSLEAVVSPCSEHADYEHSSFSPQGKAARLGRAFFQVPTRTSMVRSPRTGKQNRRVYRMEPRILNLARD